MSALVSSVLDGLFENREARILMVGDNATGKTRLKLNEQITTIPTIGFNVETIEHKHVSFTMWDVGGKDKIRPLWRHYYQNTQAIIFVIDSTARWNIDDPHTGMSMKDELNRMLAEDELRDVVLLVFANKQDLPNAMSVTEITERLALNSLRNRTWYVQSCCALTGEGLHDGLEWIAQALRKQATQRNYSLATAKHNISRKIADVQREKEEKLQAMRRENEIKVVLAISGYVRRTATKNKLMTFIPVSVTKMIHAYYQPDGVYHDDKYLYYGELVENGQDETVQLSKPEILLEFLARKEVDEQYILDDDAFIAHYAKHVHSKQETDQEHDNEAGEEEKAKRAHYDFLRMIFLMFQKHGRSIGLQKIWKQTPYSVTVTYFWSQLIYFGMHKSSQHSMHTFEQCLVMNPCFANNYDGLMRDYYSAKLLKVIDGEKSKEMVLPDIKPLPSLITDVNKLKQQQAETTKKVSDDQVDGEEKDDNHDIDDDALFIVSFENRTYKQWENHKSFLRVIWVYVEQHDGSQQAVSKIMSEWKEFRGEDNYHETIVYFWIHIVRYYRVLYREYFDALQKSSNSKHGQTNKTNESNGFEWNFRGFLKFCSLKSNKKCAILDEDWWKKFYSDSVIYHRGFNGIDASKNMVLPDLRNLPQLQMVKKK